MGLELDVRGAVLSVLGLADVGGFAGEVVIVLHQHVVVQNRHAGRRLHAAVIIECRGSPDDVVGLPFAGFAAGDGQRGRLLVDAGGLAVHVGGVLVGVHDLKLVSGIASAGGGEEQAGVAA